MDEEAQRRMVDATGLLAYAKRALQDGHVDEAEGTLAGIAQLDVEVRDFHLVAALCAHQRGELGRAAEELRQEVTAFPDNEIARRLLQVILAAQPGPEGRTATPVDDFEREPPEGKIDLFLSLSTVCNYRCVFCSNPTVDPRDKVLLKLESIQGFDALIRERARLVDITGWGEVTLHPEFEAILDYVTRNGASVRMVTNGSNLTEKTVDALGRARIGEVVISVNSLDPDTYQRLHQRPLEPVLKGIERLSRVLDHPRKMSFSFVTTAWNLGELRHFIDFGKRHSTHVACLGLTPTLRDFYPPGLQVEPTPANLALIEDAKAYARAQGVSFWITPHDVRESDGVQARAEGLSERIRKCRWVHTKFFISHDGDVVPCCWSKRVMGNMKRQTFEEIWGGSEYQDLRSRILAGDLTYCRNCGAY